MTALVPNRFLFDFEFVLPYRAVPAPDKKEIVNRLMHEKYDWGDSFFATFYGSREGAIPVELHQAEE